MRTPSRRVVTRPACFRVCRCADAVVRFRPAARARASTLRSPWARRSSSSRRFPLASAFPTRASASNSVALRTASPMASSIVPWNSVAMSFAAEQLIPLVDVGLGNSAYLVDLGDGRALAVDAARDLRALRAAADARGLRVAFAADTHLHADFLTGAVQLAHDDGATVLASAAGGRRFAHVPLGDGDEVDLGGLTLQALATPGHTDEHLSYLLLDGARQLGVFTGGSLIVDAAARTDLLGAGRADELARAQFRSLRRLANLPDDTGVWPTHGAGSFCSAPPGAERTTTIGAQKRANPLLAAPDEDAFVRQLIDSLGSYPVYFDRLAELNRRGPAAIRTEPG